MCLYLCYLQKPSKVRKSERYGSFLPRSPQMLFLNGSKHISSQQNNLNADPGALGMTYNTVLVLV